MKRKQYKKKRKKLPKNKPNNVTKLVKKNITLDPGSEGKRIRDLDYYLQKDPERWLTIDDCLELIPHLLKKRTWEWWRGLWRDTQDITDPECQIGPQWKRFGLKLVKVKVKWLANYRDGLPWEHTEPQLAAEHTPTPKANAANSI